MQRATVKLQFTSKFKDGTTSTDVHHFPITDEYIASVIMDAVNDVHFVDMDEIESAHGFEGLINFTDIDVKQVICDFYRRTQDKTFTEEQCMEWAECEDVVEFTDAKFIVEVHQYVIHLNEQNLLNGNDYESFDCGHDNDVKSVMDALLAGNKATAYIACQDKLAGLFRDKAVITGTDICQSVEFSPTVVHVDANGIQVSFVITATFEVEYYHECDDIYWCHATEYDVEFIK